MPNRAGHPGCSLSQDALTTVQGTPAPPPVTLEHAVTAEVRRALLGQGALPVLHAPGNCPACRHRERHSEGLELGTEPHG